MPVSVKAALCGLRRKQSSAANDDAAEPAQHLRQQRGRIQGTSRATGWRPPVSCAVDPPEDQHRPCPAALQRLKAKSVQRRAIIGPHKSAPRAHSVPSTPQTRRDTSKSRLEQTTPPPRTATGGVGTSDRVSQLRSLQTPTSGVSTQAERTPPSATARLLQSLQASTECADTTLPRRTAQQRSPVVHVQPEASRQASPARRRASDGLVKVTRNASPMSMQQASAGIFDRPCASMSTDQGTSVQQGQLSQSLQERGSCTRRGTTVELRSAQGAAVPPHVHVHVHKASPVPSPASDVKCVTRPAG